MAARLKVFRYSDGFHAWTVAASSRAKALAAWGVKRDLFKDGSAEEIDSGADHDAALKAPGDLIERGLAVDVGETRKASSKVAKPSVASVKVRGQIEALEHALDDLDQHYAAKVEEIEAARAALDEKAAVLEASYGRDRDGVKAKLKTARARVR
jgi:DNA-binding FrmR family transcriptional regulator